MVQVAFDLRARQQTTLTPRLQQSVKLLQMSAIEFNQELQQAIATNPFLEEEEEAPESIDAQDSSQVELAGLGPTERDAALDGQDAKDSLATNADTPESAEADLASDSLDVYEESVQDGPSDTADYRSTTGEGERGELDEWIRNVPALREHLHQELSSYRLEPRDRGLAELVIEALDDDGYLRDDLEDLASSLDLDMPVSIEELSAAVKLVQQLDVPGIGARSLSECLLLQLEALPPDTIALDVAKRLVDGQMERLARREYAELQRVLQCDERAIRLAHQLIRTLDPKPGLRFGRSDAQYVVPDVLVRKIKGKWVVQTNPAVMPRARLHRTYADMFRRARCSDRAPMAQELQEARWLIRNVEQRFSTIQRVAEAIVQRQRTFFEYGDVALKPLVLREVADELGLHESTVSRATGNKYMATPRGIFEFKHFFSRELATDTGGQCSAAAVRALLKEMITSEDRKDPLSDVLLTKMLADQGVIVARRTVAKYRGLMKVPPAELRRQV
ncbi:MAG: RNA polymerase factor sigma-54 [Burkholderiaceae bacterium]